MDNKMLHLSPFYKFFLDFKKRLAFLKKLCYNLGTR